MPMAAAHARRLLDRGNAHYDSHHAFTIIRLRTAQPAPVLRPVVLAVHLGTRVIELVLLIERVRGVVPVLQAFVPQHRADHPLAAQLRAQALPTGLTRRAQWMARISARRAYRIVQLLTPIVALFTALVPLSAIVITHGTAVRALVGPLPVRQLLHRIRRGLAWRSALLLRTPPILAYDQLAADWPRMAAALVHGPVRAGDAMQRVVLVLPAPQVSLQLGRYRTADAHGIERSQIAVVAGTHASGNWQCLCPSRASRTEIHWVQQEVPRNALRGLQRVHDVAVLPIVAEATAPRG